MRIDSKPLRPRRHTRDVSETMDLTIVYEDGVDGWIVASIPAVPGVMSQDRTQDEARENVLDTLALMLSPEPAEAGDEREREACPRRSLSHSLMLLTVRGRRSGKRHTSPLSQ